MSATRIAPRQPPKKRDWNWRSQYVRGLIYQVLALAAIGFVVWFLAHNTLLNMRTRGIQSGFDFLLGPAGFDIGEMLIKYDALDPYWKAFAVGVLNTLRVAIVGIILTTVIGTLVGIGRFSRNAIVRGLCYGYVELFRNIPVLLQLLMWYLLFTEVLPATYEAWSIAQMFFLSKGGVAIPAPVWGLGQGLAAVGALAGLAVAYAYRQWARRRFEATGNALPVFWPSVAIVIGIAFIGWIAGGAPTAWNMPSQGEVMVEGGMIATPEFLAVLFGLVMYTAAFVAEVVRAGIQSVAHGQVEAASSLGLSRGQSMRLVILPQALRVIIPPMTNQYLNLTKNSSLAVAIGYPDVVSISNTAINQTGRAVECIAIIMLVYLTTSLATSAFMGWYNKRAAIKER
jgi:general L-amino acid transport system permease protein